MKSCSTFLPATIRASMAALALVAMANSGVAQASGNDAESSYKSRVRPLLKTYCHKCHSEKLMEADIDLSAFATLADVRRQTKAWSRVLKMLDSGQMPPRDARQPSDAQRTELLNWVRDFLTAEARANAGDPGPVLLRRLSNAEYTYTVRDLTGVESFDPAAEFPVDGAAGEGFTNVGSGQGMSPAMVQKYLDAAKEISGHAVLTPTGIRFSPHTSARDQTDELLARIQAFYRRYTSDGGGAAVDLQGIRFNTNQGGLLPLEDYLAATLAERDALLRGATTIEDVARERSLSPRYLATLWNVLQRKPAERPSTLVDGIRERWKQASAGDAGKLAAEIDSLRAPFWKFNPVGHIGRDDGPKMWLEPLSPVTTRVDLQLNLPAVGDGSDVVFYLAASEIDALGAGEVVVLERPRIEFTSGDADSQTPILLREVRARARQTAGTVASDAAHAQQYLAAVEQLHRSSATIEEVARERGLNKQALNNWSARVRLGNRTVPEISGLFTEKLTNAEHKAIRGWGSHATPCLLTNSSDSPIVLGTLTVPARGVTLHPSPALETLIAWRSPIAGRVRIEGSAADADNKCGNGAAWRLELRTASDTRVLADGVIDNGGNAPLKLDAVQITAGDVVSLVVNARDRDHVCDTTHVEFKLGEVEGKRRVWDLATDVVDKVHDGNPLPDSYGNRQTWHFCAAENRGDNRLAGPLEAQLPPGSALSRWRTAVVAGKPAEEVESLAAAVQKMLTEDDAARLSEPDELLRRRLLTGLDPLRFGRHPDEAAIDEADLCLPAPQVLEVRLPAQLAAGGRFVATVVIPAKSSRHRGVRIQASATKPDPTALASQPILVSAGEGQRRMDAAIQEFRDLFPPAVCYARIVPVDEVVTLKLFYREDDQLRRLMLDDRQAAELDRLWDELFYVSREPLQLAVSLEQIAEFATQDNPAGAKAFAAMRTPINERADAFRRRMVALEQVHIKAVLELAGRAWRRKLSDDEAQDLRMLYHALRENEIGHEQAVRLTLARVLTSPAFLYKLEQPAPGERPAPVTDMELATRLSYFLWSSLPDEALRASAAGGKLTDDDELLLQTRRMLADPKIRRLAVQFACQWLHVRDFDQNDDKNEKLYPEFASLRSDMYEETVRFFEDMFARNGSILDTLDADHTFVNPALAKHYGIDDLAGEGWRRIDGVRDRQRGGVLAMSTFLAGQSGASRTSPILRGNWIYETLLGERLPRPPANVPQLPETVPEELTARQLIERHSSDPACAKCHARIDPYGFALEHYDAIGRLRRGQSDTKTRLFTGEQIEGIDGLRSYLVNQRREDFVRQFCRKLLGFALGRELQLSDEPLLAEMQSRLKANGYRFHVAAETIVTSRQFRDIRGEQAADMTSDP